MATNKKQPAKTKKRLTHHAKHIFVPHKGNEYRPHLIRWKGLTAVFAVALVMQLVYSFATTGTLQVLGRESDITIGELLDKTNVERTNQGLPALSLSNALDKAAYLKAQDMFANDYWAHTSPSGVSPWKWLGDVAYNYSVAGENLAKNYPTSQATVDAWMASPSHKDNVLGEKYTEVGFAVVDGTLNSEPTTLVVAYYGTPAPAVASATDVNEPAPAALTFEAPVNTQINSPIAYFGSAIQSLTPATVGVIGMLAIVAFVAAIAHHYRKRLPKSWQKSWKLHHGAYIFSGVIVFGVLLIAATGGGQI